MKLAGCYYIQTASENYKMLFFPHKGDNQAATEELLGRIPPSSMRTLPLNLLAIPYTLTIIYRHHCTSRIVLPSLNLHFYIVHVPITLNPVIWDNNFIAECTCFLIVSFLT